MKRLSMSLVVVSVIFTVLIIISTPVPAQLYVYQDEEDEEVLFSASAGMMPNGQGISLNRNFDKNCYNERCIRVGVRADLTSEDWAGVYWYAKNSQGGAGINIYDELGVKEGTPIKLTFWARGEVGDERVNFKVGGVDIRGDSIVFPKETGWITLQEEWQQYEINLLGEDLSNVVGGFCWVTAKDQNPENQVIWTYLDEIKYEVDKRKLEILDAIESAPMPTCGERRLALIIGNAAYQHVGELKNPVNDACDMKTTLELLGFNVIKHENVSQEEMEQVIGSFGQRLDGYDVGLFFYAGHGVQINGENYLIPIDARLHTQNDVFSECVRMRSVLDQMRDVRLRRINFIILDACRNNPFIKRWVQTRGLKIYNLAPVDAPSGSLIAYATAPGKTASDGPCENGLYTEALLNYIREPNMPIETVFKCTRIATIEASRRLLGIQDTQDMESVQTPWESTSLTKNFYFTCAQGAGLVNECPPIAIRENCKQP